MNGHTVVTGERNWAGNYTYRAAEIHRPSSIDELREIVSTAPRVRVLGSRHSFSDVADSEQLVHIGGLPRRFEVDRDASTVTFSGGMTYGELAPLLEAEGLALHNLASLPHISVAGAVATGTHGSGNRNGNLATAVAGLEILTSNGDLLTAVRSDPDFAGMVVNVGALGAVTALTLDVEPAYSVRQRVFEHLPWDAVYSDLDGITGAAYSTSLFTRFSDTVEMVWLKSRVTDEAEDVRTEFFGATPAPADRHPIPELSAERCTPQLGVPGPWWERLPHFVMGFTPSNGDEIQSEFLVPREHAVDAIRAVQELRDQIVPLLQICEIRTMAADELWLSPQYGTDTIGLHFTWRQEQEAVDRIAAVIEDALRPFNARPHWGKVFAAGAADIAPLYPKLPQFLNLVESLDPRGAFRNPWLERTILGA